MVLACGSVAPRGEVKIMALLREEEFPADGGTPQVQDGSSKGSGADKAAAHRAGGDLPADVLIAAHDRTIDFHDQEIREAGRREMPEWQLDIHEWQLQLHLAALASFGVTEVTPEDPELPPRQSHVPASAMPEFSNAA